MKPRWLKRKRFRQLTPADPLLIAGGGDVVAQHRLVRFSNGSRMAASGARSATERASEFWGQGDDPWRRWFVQVCDKLVLSVAGALMLIVDRLIALLALPMMLLGRLRRLILLALPMAHGALGQSGQPDPASATHNAARGQGGRADRAGATRDAPGQPPPPAPPPLPAHPPPVEQRQRQQQGQVGTIVTAPPRPPPAQAALPRGAMLLGLRSLPLLAPPAPSLACWPRQTGQADRAGATQRSTSSASSAASAPSTRPRCLAARCSWGCAACPCWRYPRRYPCPRSRAGCAG